MEKERLSEDLKHCLHADSKDCGDCDYVIEKLMFTCGKLLRKSYEKIKEYEDLEEQGKLVKLPCKIGDKSFWISDEDKNGNKVLNVREGNPIIGIAIKKDGIYIMSDGDDDYQKVGTRWAYLTRKEAETALSELQR